MIKSKCALCNKVRILDICIDCYNEATEQFIKQGKEEALKDKNIIKMLKIAKEQGILSERNRIKELIKLMKIRKTISYPTMLTHSYISERDFKKLLSQIDSPPEKSDLSIEDYSDKVDTLGQQKASKQMDTKVEGINGVQDSYIPADTTQKSKKEVSE